MADLIKTKRGLDIQISGKAQEIIGDTIVSEVVALIPDHYHGIVPKLIVKVGDEVKAGSPIFHDKTFTNMNFVAPLSGKISAINRGDRRRIMSIIIDVEDKIVYETFTSEPISKLSGDEIKIQLLTAGIWPFIKQRPYDVIITFIFLFSKVSSILTGKLSLYFSENITLLASHFSFVIPIDI